MAAIELNDGQIGAILKADSRVCGNLKPIDATASDNLLHSIAIKTMEADGYTLEFASEGVFDLVFRKGNELSFVKVAQVSEFNEEKTNFLVPLDTWLEFLEGAAAAAKALGIFDEAVVRLDEIKMIFAKDGKVGIQRVLGHHPLEQAA